MQPSCALIVVLYRPVEIRWWGQWDTRLENGFRDKGAHCGKARLKKKYYSTIVVTFLVGLNYVSMPSVS